MQVDERGKERGFHAATLDLLPLLVNLNTMATTQRPIVFMDINIGETPAGRLKMELFSDIVPKFARLPLPVLRLAPNFVA